jgi:branched-chain amino acid transport system ATP-binding protein
VSPALSVSDLVVGYDPGVPIVNGASLSVSPGEIVALLGPNGAGKSTLIKAIAGVAPVRAGVVRLGEEDITRLPAHLLVRHGLAFVPQTENVFTRLSIEDNLKLAAGVLKPGARAGRIAEVYRMFPDLLRQRRLLAGHLSGGQRQMLAIARALIVGPRVLMLDEPSAGLSPKLVGIVFAKLAEIRAGGVSILLVEQNARAALAVADRGVVLVEGRNRHEGPAAELWGDARIAELYLGGARAAVSSEQRP